MKKPNLQSLQKRVDDWNATVPIGTLVEYHPIIGAPAHRLRKTRTAAQVLSGHTAVVWLEDESGCVALEACAVPKSGNDYPD